MSEIARIARLLEQTFEGKPYHGPSVLDALAEVTTEVAASKPQWSAHSIWELVTHLTAELNYARAVIEGTPGPWIEGETTWPAISDTSDAAWQHAISDLKKANRALVRAVKRLNDDVLDKKPMRVRGPFYLMLHGTIQHNIFHAGQISLLTGQAMRLLYKPGGYTSVSPYLIVDGASRTIDFLVRVFDAVELRRFPDSAGRLMHAEVRIDDTVVMIADHSEGWPSVPSNVHIYITDVDATYRRALEVGATSVQEPVKKDDEDRRGGVKDAGGTTWWIATKVE